MDALTTDHPYYRAEFDWLARDVDRCVAVLCSAGFGPVAPASLDDAEILETLLDDLVLLPVIAVPRVVSSSRTPIEIYREIAKRGFFLFDWNTTMRRYDLLLAPDPMLHVEDVQDEVLRDAIQRVLLPVRYSEVTSLAPEVGVVSTREGI